MIFLPPLHLLRALLRQCTYLPDSAARAYGHSYILEQFRRYPRLPRNALPQTIERRSKRLPKLIRDARKGLSLLERANNGTSHAAMQRILLLTYGRIGKRRHLLLLKFLNPSDQTEPNLRFVLTQGKDPEFHNEALVQGRSKFLDRYSTPTVRPGRRGELQGEQQVFSISPNQAQLRALVLSHITASIFDPERRKLRHAYVTAPSTNAWGRPLPRKRVYNLVKKQDAELLDTLLPPLPEAEFERLDKLVTGAIPWEEPPRLRPRGTSKYSETDKVEELITALDVALRIDGVQPKPRPVGKPCRHRITQRYMQRLWSRVLQQIPLLRWKEAQEDGQGKWEVAWADLSEPVPTDDMALFEMPEHQSQAESQKEHTSDSG